MKPLESKVGGNAKVRFKDDGGGGNAIDRIKDEGAVEEEDTGADPTAMRQAKSRPGGNAKGCIKEGAKAKAASARKGKPKAKPKAGDKSGANLGNQSSTSS